ncbi:hypothetical protein F5146DRAFT_1016248 [Armillaria mellea]|nr:hypothetical protein F5146DRAFT_1016248 [Armillaria mellea]
MLIPWRQAILCFKNLPHHSIRIFVGCTQTAPSTRHLQLLVPPFSISRGNLWQPWHIRASIDNTQLSPDSSMNNIGVCRRRSYANYSRFRRVYYFSRSLLGLQFFSTTSSILPGRPMSQHDMYVLFYTFSTCSPSTLATNPFHLLSGPRRWWRPTLRTILNRLSLHDKGLFAPPAIFHLLTRLAVEILLPPFPANLRATEERRGHNRLHAGGIFSGQGHNEDERGE